MVRTLIMLVALTLAGAFAYFYFSNSGNRSGSDRLADAAEQTGAEARDQATGLMVKTRLATAVGIGVSRFLHVWCKDGKVLIYGLLPESVNPQTITTAVQGWPGVREVELLTAARPAYLDGTTAAPPPPPPGG